MPLIALGLCGSIRLTVRLSSEPFNVSERCAAGSDAVRWTGRPRCASANATAAASVVFPTPPLPISRDRIVGPVRGVLPDSVVKLQQADRMARGGGGPNRTGRQIERFNLAQQPMAFAQNEAVKRSLELLGEDVPVLQQSAGSKTW